MPEGKLVFVLMVKHKETTRFPSVKTHSLPMRSLRCLTASLIACLAMLFASASFAQTVTCSFSPPNQSMDTLTTCSQVVTTTITSNGNLSAGDSIRFSFHNSVAIVSSSPTGVASYAGFGVHVLAFASSGGNDTIVIQWLPASCNLYTDGYTFASPSPIFFRCTYDSSNVYGLQAAYPPGTITLSAANQFVLYHLQSPIYSVQVGSPSFVIPGVGTYSSYTGASGSGAGGSSTTRYFAIKFTTDPTSIDTLRLVVTQEGDADHNLLQAEDTNQDSLAIPAMSVAANVFTFDLSAFIDANPSYIFTDADSVKWLLLKQTVTRHCVSAVPPSTTINAVVPCAPCNSNSASSSGQLNVTISTNAATLTRTATVTPGTLDCHGDSTYVYSLAFRSGAAPFLFGDITVPYNDLYFNLDSVALASPYDQITLDTSMYVNSAMGQYSFIAIDFSQLSQAPPGLTDSTTGMPVDAYYLPAGDTFIVMLYLSFDCAGGTLQQCDSTQQYSLSSFSDTLFYKTACAAVNSDSTWSSLVINSLPGVNAHQVSSLTGAFNPQDLTMGSSIAAKFIFNYNTDLSPFAITQGGNTVLDCDSVTFYAVLTVPYYIGASDFFILVSGDSVPVDAVYDSLAHTYTIPYQAAIEAYNDSVGGPVLDYNHIQIHFTSGIVLDSCPFAPATFGGFHYAMQIRAQCDDCDECFRVIRCIDVPMFVHCPGLCPGAVVGTESVELERTTFGWHSLNDYLANDSTPTIDASYYWASFGYDTADYELHKVYACDSVKVTAHGWALDTSFTNIGFELAYAPAFGALDTANNILNCGQATFTFANSAGAAPVLTYTLDAPTSIYVDTVPALDSMIILRFSIGPFTPDSLVNQFLYDSVTFTATFGVNPDSVATPWPLGAYYIPQVRGQFVNTNTTGAFVNSCDPWGDDLTVLIVGHTTAVVQPTPGCNPNGYVLNGDTIPMNTSSACTFREIYAVKMLGGFGPIVDDFPYEYRPYLEWPLTGFLTLGQNLGLIEVSDMYNFANADNNFNIVVSDSSFIYDAAPPLRIVEKGDPTLTTTQQGIVLMFSKHCINAGGLATPHLDIRDHLYAMPVNACVDTITLPLFGVNSNNVFNCNNPYLPLCTTPLSTINAVSAVQNVTFTFSYNPPGAPCDTVQLPNVWFSYTLTNGVDTLPLPAFSAATTSTLPIAILQHPTVANYAYFQDTVSGINGLHGMTVVTIPVSLNCQDTSNYVLTMRYGTLCDSADFAAFLSADSSTIDTIVDACSVCSRTVTIHPTDSVALLGSELSMNGTCDHLFWTMDMVNLSSDTIDASQLLVHNPVALPYDGANSYVVNGSDTLQPFLPDSTNLLVWNYPSGNTVPSVTMWFSTGADTIPPGDTLHLALGFQIDCSLDSLLPDVLYGLFVGFDACTNLIDSSIVLAFVSAGDIAGDTCCHNSEDDFTLNVLNPCTDTAAFTLQINHPTHDFVVNLTDSLGNGVIVNDTLNAADSLYTSPPLSPGDYAFSIFNTTTFIQHNQLITVVAPDSFAVTIAAYGTCADTLYDSLVAVVTGDSVQYTVEWSTGDTTLVIDSVPPGIYSITVTSINGCSTSVIDTLPALTPELTVSADYANACDAPDGIVMLVASGADSLVWSPSYALDTLAGDTVIATPTQTTTYTVTAVTDSGCVATDTIVVTVDCCVPIYGDAVPFAGNSVSNLSFLAGGTYANDSITILGDLIVDTNLNLSNTIVSVYAGKRIFVLPGVTLNLNNCVLYACTKMWKGIFVSDSAGLVMDSTTLLDAEIGVELESSTTNYITSTHSTFGKNHIGLKINVTPGLNALNSVTSTNFQCKSNAAYSPGNFLKAPYNDSLSYAGIYLDSVAGCKIGNHLVAADRNKFDSLRIGIYSYKARLQVYNCEFTNLREIDCALSGIGIWKVGGWLEAGGYGSYYKNIFFNCTRGIMAEHNSLQGVSVKGNDFLNIYRDASCTTTPTPAAVFIRNAKSTNIEFKSNYLKYCRNGFATLNLISCDMAIDTNTFASDTSNCIWLRKSKNCKIAIRKDTINEGFNGQWCGYAINIQNDIGTTNNIFVGDNYINRCNNGVFIQIAPTPTITRNWIEFNMGTAGLVSRYGIRLNDCDGARVSRNVVIMYPTSATHPTAAYIDKLFGSYTEFSLGTQFSDNAFTRMGTSIGFLGDNTGGFNSPATLQCNYMKNYVYGVRMDSCSIGHQGSSATSQVNDNQWELTGTFSGQIGLRKGVKGIGNVTFTNWYHRSGSNLSLTTGEINPLGIAAFIPVSSPSNSYICTDYSILAFHPEYCQMVTNDYPYEIELIGVEADYINKWRIYHEILQDSTILDGDCEDDLRNFIDTFATSRAGILEYVEALLADGDTTAVGNALSNLDPHYRYEQNLRDVLQVYYETWARDVLNFTAEQDSILRAIAVQNPNTGGRAVFIARNMVDVDYDDYLEADTSGSRVEEFSDVVPRYVLYPNPADDIFTYVWSGVDCKSGLIEIFDVLGRRMIHQAVECVVGAIEVPTADWTPGLYQLKFSHENVILDTRKVVVQR